MMSLSQALISISWFFIVVTCEECQRHNSRIVRNVVHQELMPVYKDLGVKIPYECPFFKERDRYLDNEEHKERESVNRWSCGYCGKAFIGEIYLDAHFDNRHAKTIFKEKESICLADYCEIFRCDVISGETQATFWDVALCMEEDMQDLTQDCQEILNTCIPDKLSWNVTNRLRTSLTNSVCSYLTCKKYWDAPVVTEEQDPPTVYIVCTVLLTVGMAIYYCVAFNYFLTDTFGDMYDSDEVVVRNPERLSNPEPSITQKKSFRHRTKPKAFIDSEKFFSPDRLSSRQRQNSDSNRDRVSKRRHLETNDDLFNIRRSRENTVDVNGLCQVTTGNVSGPGLDTVGGVNQPDKDITSTMNGFGLVSAGETKDLDIDNSGKSNSYINIDIDDKGDIDRDIDIKEMDYR